MAIDNKLLSFLFKKNTLEEFFDTWTHEVNLCHMDNTKNSFNETKIYFSCGLDGQ